MASPFQPLAEAQKSAALQTLGAVHFLSTVRNDASARALLQPATLTQLDAVVYGTTVLVLDAVKDAVTTPGGNLEAAAIQAFGMMHAVLTDVEAVSKTQPALATHPTIVAAVQQYKDLQAAGATLQLQQRQLELVDKTLALAKHL